VYLQTAKDEKDKIKLNGLKPDYILYQSGTDRAIAIIEAKKGGENLDKALNQAIDYAKSLGVKIVFATNGAYCETRFLPNNKGLILNGEEVREIIKESEILRFLKEDTNEVWTISQEVKTSREELISRFKNLNDILRGEGLRAGIERFGEFANILFLKLLSENNENNSEKSWWESIKKQSDEDIIGYINGYVINQIQEKYGGDVFNSILIKNPKTIRYIIDAIDPLILSTMDTDIKGDAFEYFLEKTASTENDLGEYFTPRNIVRTIINLVNPRFKETIYDPFCGTGGFLTEAFSYIKENNIIESEEDLKILKEDTFYGREITDNARIAKMNMILRGDGHSGIQQIDTLVNPDFTISGGKVKKFDLIVTNVPFTQKITDKTIKNGKTNIGNNISTLYYNGIGKNNGDAVCVLHCLNSLKEGGRMALVVPEGFLFNEDLADVRKFILSKARLHTVISLPKGTFEPYTGVKTDILYFTDAHKPNSQKNYWFFEVKNIGVTLNKHKRKILGYNDLNKIEGSDISKIDKILDSECMTELGFESIDMMRVKENDYNLVGNVYRKNKIESEHKCVSLFEVLSTLETGSRPKGGVAGINQGAISLGGEQIGADGRLNLLKVPYVTMEFFKNAKKGFINDKDILICKDGALTGKLCIVNFRLFPQKEVMTNEHVFILRGNNELIKQGFLFYTLRSDKVQEQIKKLAYNKSAQHGLNIQHIKSIQIPLPSLEEQQKIVDELDSCQKITDGAKQVIENWETNFEIKTNWSIKKLQDLCTNYEYGYTSKSDKCGDVRYIRITDIESSCNQLRDNAVFITLNNKNKKFLLKKDDILIARIGSVGKSFLYEKDEVPGIFASYLIRIHFDKNIILPKYLRYFFDTEYYWTQVRKLTNGAVQHQFNVPVLKEIQIPLPSLEEQQKIVDELDEIQRIVDENKKMIKIQQDRIGKKLNSIWQSDSL